MPASGCVSRHYEPLPDFSRTAVADDIAARDRLAGRIMREVWDCLIRVVEVERLSRFFRAWQNVRRSASFAAGGAAAADATTISRRVMVR